MRKDSDAVAALAQKLKDIRIAVCGNDKELIVDAQGYAEVIHALESASSPTKTLKQVAEKVEARINGRSNHDNLPAVTDLLDQEDAWFLHILTTSTDETDGKGGTGS